jgi:hypothetical protein
MKYNVSDFVDFRKHKTVKELKQLLKECDNIPRKMQLEKNRRFTGRITNEQSMLVKACKKKIKEKLKDIKEQSLL